MSIDLDDEILQDFLVEAGEILELLSEQLVQLENAPDDMELLNAVFRGFHTVKGGAGFLALDPMVDTCHVCEDVFNVLRQGDRRVSPALMDAVLQGLDGVQIMFAEIKNGEDPTPATPELLATLKTFSVPGDDDTVAADAGETEAVTVAETEADTTTEHDATDDEFDALLDAMDSDETPAASAIDSDEITDDEFENLLDDIHGKGRHSGKPEAGAVDKPAASAPAGDVSDEMITDDEFDNLLDQLHGKGKGPTVLDGEQKPAVSKEDKPVAKPPASGASDELITDDEFDQLLDDLHGKGQGPGVASASAKAKQPEADKPAVKKAAAAPVAKAAAPGKPAAPVKEVAKPAAKPAAETSVRVDTERLDEIMNLVGELVLVRNRLQNLRSTLGEGQLTQAITNLGMVTSDLQTSVMKTRMQPIKKVFGRFPRVVRDLSRQINKEIKLEMMGEETDLDKNLVEALADPLVHLVRNAVDHGIEAPDVREKKGKPREGTVNLSATQEGDHILLSIEDDGAGMDPEVLRRK
ncbi:MAG: Hpt domain-containing protein, partial [Gammaproteobacteria bacterium]|nr:Hpt domain-containing protein [Gammaproteobacteria bacterium]